MAIQKMSYDLITSTCIDFYEKDTNALKLLEMLMDCAGVPMHDPIHHYIVPAALLTVAAKKYNHTCDELAQKLAIAEERAKALLPGFCGWWGCCGAAAGCGIFASVWLGASPKQEKDWAAINMFTSRCLASVASVGGPRCCKRTSYLALKAAVSEAPGLLGTDLGTIPDPVCTWSPFNNECRKGECPFFTESSAKIHSNLKMGIAPRL